MTTKRVYALSGHLRGEWATLADLRKLIPTAHIGNMASIGNWTSIGDGASIGSGASIADGARIGDEARIGDGASIMQSPLYIQGSCHPIGDTGAGMIFVGCEVHEPAHWLAHYAEIGMQNDYTLYQIEEYGHHLRYVAECMKRATEDRL